MKQSEKLDLILKGLYKYKKKDSYPTIENICKEQNIPTDSDNEIRMLAHRLNGDNLIDARFTKSDTLVSLTSHGIEYCEENSYSIKGKAIIENMYNVTISNSPNTNIVSNSTNTSIQIKNSSEIKNKITEIHKSIEKNNEISIQEKENLFNCLEEIKTSIEIGKKPKFSFKQLTELGSNVAGISSLLIDLGKLIFVS